MRRIAVICALFAVSIASYDNPSDSSPDGVQAFNPSHSPDPSCNLNEEYIQCATHCEPSCTNPNPVCIRSCAPAQCQCAYGYVRNEKGECVDTSGCPHEEETTTVVFSSTDLPLEETTTFSPPIQDNAPQYVNPPSPPPFEEEPSTTSTQEYDSVPTEAAAPVYEETTAPLTVSESPSKQTASTSSEYSSGGNGESKEPISVQNDDDVIVVGGSCGENTCRVGFRCDDSTSEGARCIPFDTRARSSCSSIRCRPGWSCVIAMDGPRCYRNEVLRLADPQVSTSGKLPVSDYSAGPPSLPSETPATCAATSCLVGSLCVEHPEGARCEAPTTGPLVFAGRTCADSVCPSLHQCFDAIEGASCYPFPTDPIESISAPLKCDQMTCNEGEKCVDDEKGGVCTPRGEEAPTTSTLYPEESAANEVPAGDEQHPQQDCEHTSCPTEEHCAVDFEGNPYCRAKEGVADEVDPVSAPIVTVRDPEIPSCQTMKCTQDELCLEESTGPRCVPTLRRGISAPGYRRRLGR